jgi:hypothetical protein
MSPTLQGVEKAWLTWFTEVQRISASVQNFTFDGDRGDVTVSGSGAVWTIDPKAVTLAKVQDVPTSTFLGRTTAGTGSVETLTPTQVTAALDSFSGTVKGLVPASPGGTRLLQADGAWVQDVTVNNLTVGGGLKFGVFTVSALAPVTGYITVTDSGGTVRHLAVV